MAFPLYQRWKMNKRRASTLYTTSYGWKCARTVSYPGTFEELIEAEAAELRDNPGVFLELKNPQACLDGIPEELLLEICEHLWVPAVPDAFSSLAMLGRTNKRCKRVADEFLYKLTRDDTGQIEALDENPKLAGLVDTLQLYSLDYEMEQDKEHIRQKRHMYTRVLQSMVNIKHFDIMFNDPKLPNTSADHPAWMLGILNVLYKFERDIINSNASNQFMRLEVVTLDGIEILMVEDISPIFRLPSLKTLTLNGFLGPDHMSRRTWDIPDSSSSIQHLRLPWCFIGSEVVLQMLSAIKALKEFDFHYTTEYWRPLSPDTDPACEWAELSFTEMGDAIGKHKESLEELTILAKDDGEMEDMVYPEGWNAGKIGSLRDFSKLKSLSSHLRMFLYLNEAKDDINKYLPAGLERLRMHCPEWDVVEESDGDEEPDDDGEPDDDEEEDEPGEEFDEHGEEYDGYGEEYDGYGGEYDGHGEEFYGDGQEFDGHGQEFDGHGEQFYGHGEQFHGPGQQFYGPGQQFYGSGEQFYGSGEQFHGHGEQFYGLGEQFEYGDAYKGELGEAFKAFGDDIGEQKEVAYKIDGGKGYAREKPEYVLDGGHLWT
ncbi:hypothetical protein N0V83_004255 [Neocucurbitaria cava]|uniref:F-box domain-containing protein n=1 Tax=Neocucurbitaria cava TaxID=798079 RepID=A0A9W8YDD4_9PLEO|nr:hypothetical protein N0V83_004255 [Neocucurbitaria cava]